MDPKIAYTQHTSDDLYLQEIHSLESSAHLNCINFVKVL
jgi:hypothetical protein